MADVNASKPAAGSPGFDEGPLGHDSQYASTYTPSLLHPIERAVVREQAGIAQSGEFRGEDLWTAYEFSWLDTYGKPLVAGIRLRVPCQSAAIVESKSLKLYLGSFAQTKFESQSAVLRTLDQDLTLAFRAPVIIELLELSRLAGPVQQMSGICLDDIDVVIRTYEREPELLAVEEGDLVVHEALHTHLFRSLCPVTGQPDWASVAIEYSGPPIKRDALLKYLISYRNHPAFHETTIEQIYCDIQERCRPQRLSVYGRFQRRGGVDINPYRASDEDSAPLCRLPRQ